MSWTKIQLFRIIHFCQLNNGTVKKIICHFPCLFAGTLSVCLTEDFTDPLLHTVALQFLCTLFTQETKSRGLETTTSNSKCATTLSDIVNGPLASQLCELLMQVCGGAREGAE